MAEIRLEGIAHSYSKAPRSPDDWALKSLDEVWRDGGAYALLGPSGCGKTSLLNVASGLVIPTRGRVLFDGRDVTRLPTEQRNIAQVFQFPVIYDTMTVYENLAFPLRNRGVDARTIATRVGEVAEMLELTPELHRRARSLSADVKQKTSLGRGLVRPDVAAILFDEPLTVIDPHLKWQLRRKLKEIHQRLRLTLVYVTHDQKEALTFAEQVAVMQDGRVLQVGTPQELFEAPAHRFVGFFIGSPGMNFLRCELDGNVAIVEGQRIPLDPAVATRARNEQGPYEIGIRPEFISLGGGEGGLAATVRWVEDLGSYRIVSAVIGDQPVKIKVADGLPIPEGRCAVHFAEAGTRLYAGERLVG